MAMVKKSKPYQLHDMWKDARLPDDIDFTIPGANTTIPLDKKLAE
jgi:hypothetical protein